MSAPSMKERKACWDARDFYWKCLDENTKDTSKCDKLRCSFENLCPQQWVSNYFYSFLYTHTGHDISLSRVEICIIWI